MIKEKNIQIIGAGLCGSLLALRLGQRGYNVTVFEKRPDLRKVDIMRSFSKIGGAASEKQPIQKLLISHSALSNII